MNKNSHKIVFFGSDLICLPCLQYLHRQGDASCWKLVAIVSQPDRKKGRGQSLKPNPVSEYAKLNNIKLFQPEKPDDLLVQWMRDQADLSFVMAYGHFLNKAIREACPLGMFNFHGSELPKFRGASPIETALASGESVTGVTFMKIEHKMDAGAVADYEEVQILKEDTAISLRSKIGDAVVPLLKRVLPKLSDGSLIWEEQLESNATYCRKLNKMDGLIDFNLSAEHIFDRWRAFYIWPGSFFYHKDQIIKLGAIEIYKGSHDFNLGLPAGTILKNDKNNGLIILTGKGLVRLLELQRPSGRMLSADIFLLGYPLAVGECLIGGTRSTLLSHHGK